MRWGNLTKFLVVIVAILAVAGYYMPPLALSIKQGLDLQGGTHVVLEASDTPEAKVNDDALQRVVHIIERRINELGLTEPLVQRQGDRRVIVELPGVKDPEKAIEMLGQTALMEFQDESGNIVLTGKDLKDARAQIDQSGQKLVAIEFTDEGTRKFADLTARSVGKHIAILLDKQILTNPVVQEAIPNGKAVITGNRSMEEAERLAILLRSGALPVKVDVLETRTVGPTLGEDSKAKSVEAFVIGIAAIVIFMLLFYRVSGFVANVALVLYVMLLLASLKMLNATLTLPGIAGIILSMGMAVDANVLIFERFKEEYRNGKTLRAAIDAGFTRAFSTILDSNITTLIVAAVLFFLGTGPIKGFAVTLGLGIVLSMFTAITATRFMLKILINANIIKNGKFFGA
ncbi:protein translocase subunit SecD [Sporomusa sphaeroides]|uniref:Protein translocase subunit SecD n=1 Tax=Sporomusa sphaeroides DSM 2875 TaxID=1337886 RepID=A0ABP2C7K6_9FIRM|nr:protein translocase subunit SecD [Sporomusa sphaeroides]OLS58453.1 protein translocase subunit SecD [Sporomusa sphaeroides DSM 2875]CVK19593.1 preprotein translocase subunit SecD [Sporomusa sphaeroides DSM 2875]